VIYGNVGSCNGCEMACCLIEQLDKRPCSSRSHDMPAGSADGRNINLDQYWVPCMEVGVRLTAIQKLVHPSTLVASLPVAMHLHPRNAIACHAILIQL
jgi:hypothetical protein